jgi:cell division protein FtsZ
VSSPLLETSMEGARKILLSITAGQDLSLWEVNEAAKAVAEAAHPDANIIFGAMVDETLDDQVWVTVVATGYQDGARPNARRALEEPAGEPRVERRSRPAERPRHSGVTELDVPEFMPRG